VPDGSDARLSKLLSYVLRHRPDSVGLTLDPAGWVRVDQLLAALCAQGEQLGRQDLERVIEHAAKARFALSADGQQIRASQGHSTPVDLGYAAREPPARLYHGTVERSLPSIRRAGLTRRARHHVHLSASIAAASSVGARRGPPVVLCVDAGAMYGAGHAFYLADSGVWLTLKVPVEFIHFPARK
jgi:putative RNA 2'-phosphotransferase